MLAEPPPDTHTDMAKKLVQPYVSFNGNCEEAVEFYRAAIGAEVSMMLRYKECPEPPAPGMLPAGFEEKIMHASLRVGESVLMASDSPCHGESGFAGFSLALNASSEPEASAMFAALADGGEILMPLGKTFWAPCFGMVKDRFGIRWMVSLEG